MKTIELEWDAVGNAFGYEVQLTPKGGGKPLSFRVLESKLSQAVPVGVYTVRIRSRHKEADDVWSRWSDPIALEVLIKELALLEPADQTVVEAKTDAREELTFKWTAVEKASQYTLKIWTEETKDKPLTFITRATSHKLRLIPSRVYFWQVTFDSGKTVQYAQEARTNSFTLQGAKLVKPSIVAPKVGERPKVIAWIGSPKAKSYKTRLLQRFLDETQWKPLKEEDGTSTKFNLGELKPAAYRIEVVAQAPRHANSEPAFYEFQFKPTAEQIEQALK